MTLRHSASSIFISYSRKDLAFVDRLDEGLRSRGFVPLIDRSEIYAFEDWWRRIEALVVKADTIVFVLSEHSVASPICAKEVAFAASLNKRFAPVVCTPVDNTAVPDVLQRLNFIFFDQPAVFEANLDRLSDALSVDIEWVRRHTEFGEHALKWDIAGRPGPSGLLLRPPVLEQAEAWLRFHQPPAPEPTEATRSFIAESRAAADQEAAAVRASRVTLLARVAESEQLRGNLIPALKLAMHAADLSLELDAKSRAAAHATAELAAALSRVAWQLMLAGHTSEVRWAAFSRDGNQIVTASDDGTARTWAATDGEEMATFRGHAGPVTFAAFDPDGLRIVTASADSTAKIWEACSGKELATLHGHKAQVNCAAFNADGGQIVTASNDGTARLWDAVTAKELAALSGYEAPPVSDEHKALAGYFSAYGREGLQQFESVGFASFCPDGRGILIVSTLGGDPTMVSSTSSARIWDTARKEVVQCFGQSVSCADIDCSGTRVVTGFHDGKASIWEAATAKEITNWQPHEKGMSSAAYSQDGKIVTSGRDAAVRIWNQVIPGHKRPLETLSGHSGRVHSARLNEDGSQIVTASSDATARVWRTGGRHLDLSGHLERIVSAAFADDGSRILTVCPDGAFVWDARTGVRMASIELPKPVVGRRQKLLAATLSPDGARVFTIYESDVRIWNASTGREVFCTPGSKATVSRDGTRIATASAATSGETGRVWDASTGDLKAVLPGQGMVTVSLAFSPDARQLVSIARGPERSDGSASSTSAADTVVLWDTTNGRQSAILEGHSDLVHQATFSFDGRYILTTSDDRTARIWDATTGNPAAVLRGHNDKIWSSSFSTDNSVVLTVSRGDNTARAWDVATGQEIAIMHGAHFRIWSASFAPNSMVVVTDCDDSVVRLWDAATGRELGVLRGHQGAIHCVECSADGRRVLTGGADGTARIWDTVTGREIFALRDGHELMAVRVAAFSGDGARVITGWSDARVRIWDVRTVAMPARALIQASMLRLGRKPKLTREEMRLAGYPEEMPEIDIVTAVDRTTG